jgi:hypothetical protein
MNAGRAEASSAHGSIRAAVHNAAVIAAVAEAGQAAVEPFIYQPDGPSAPPRAIGYVRGAMERRR